MENSAKVVRTYCCPWPPREHARKHVEAIRKQRLLMDATDPIPALRSTLTDTLRQSLNEVHSVHEPTHNEGIQQLVTNPTWQKLTPQQQEKILGDVGIVAPTKPDTASDATILAALDSRNLATRKAEGDAVSGRVAHALECDGKSTGAKGKRGQRRKVSS